MAPPTSSRSTSWAPAPGSSGTAQWPSTRWRARSPKVAAIRTTIRAISASRGSPDVDIGIRPPGRPYAPAATSIAWASLSPNGSRLARSSCVRTEAVNATNDRCVEGRVDVVDVSTGKPSGQPVTGFLDTPAPSSTAQVTASSRSPASGGTRSVSSCLAFRIDAWMSGPERGCGRRLSRTCRTSTSSPSGPTDAP